MEMGKRKVKMYDCVTYQIWLPKTTGAKSDKNDFRKLKSFRGVPYEFLYYNIKATPKASYVLLNHCRLNVTPPIIH